MSDLVNPYSEDDLASLSSNHSSSSQTSQTCDVNHSEKRPTRVQMPHTNFPKISPRKMLREKEKKETESVTETLNDIIETLNDIKKAEVEDKPKNVYVIPKEMLSMVIKDDATENKDKTDDISPDIIKMLNDSPPNETPKKLKKKLKDLENVTLNIAITGMTGAGKSSFVNSLRGLSSEDHRAAPTGTTETTMKPNMYQHPVMPNVKIWDLPGIGSPKFKAKNYLKDVKFNTYDFFLIVTSERFKENDIELAKAIQKSKKLFYFIRTKIDNDIRAEKHKKDFDEQNLLHNIREDCEKNLQKLGKPKVFLISSFQLEKFDFQMLVNTLEEELPENKRFALIQSLPVYSFEALTKKKTYFKKMIWLNAFAAGVGALPPIPGLSLVCDYGIMKNFFEKVYTGFGLTDDALNALSERVNKPVEELKAAKTSQFRGGITDNILMEMLSKPIIAIAKALGTIMSLLPGGALPAGGTAVASVHYLLNKGLNEMAEDTRKILIAAELEEKLK